MKLPASDQAIVDESKVVRYLLSADHPDGRSKATYFARFGFRAPRWQTLARALHDQEHGGDVTRVVKSNYGARYSVDGIIVTPDGRNPRICTVWIVDREHDAPRLMTAHPLRRRDVPRT